MTAILLLACRRCNRDGLRGGCDGGGGDFDGANAVAGEVVDGDAEEVVAGGGDGDLLVGVGAAAQHGLVDGGRQDGADGLAGGVNDGVAVGVVDHDAELEVAAVVGVDGGGEVDAVDVD